MIPSTHRSQDAFPLLLGFRNLCQHLHTDLPTKEHLMTITFLGLDVSLLELPWNKVKGPWCSSRVSYALALLLSPSMGESISSVRKSLFPFYILKVLYPCGISFSMSLGFLNHWICKLLLFFCWGTLPSPTKQWEQSQLPTWMEGKVSREYTEKYLVKTSSYYLVTLFIRTSRLFSCKLFSWLKELWNSDFHKYLFNPTKATFLKAPQWEVGPWCWKKECSCESFISFSHHKTTSWKLPLHAYLSSWAVLSLGFPQAPPSNCSLLTVLQLWGATRTLEIAVWLRSPVSLRTMSTSIYRINHFQMDLRCSNYQCYWLQSS